MVMLAALRCYTNATWTQTVHVLLAELDASFEPPVAINKAREKSRNASLHGVRVYRHICVGDWTVSAQASTLL
jgi:hypothetical protein